MSLDALVDFVREWRTANPQAWKSEFEADVVNQFGLTKERAFLVGRDFVLCVCENKKNQSLTGSVGAIQKIVDKYDDQPIVACFLTPTGYRLLLANTTFIKKVSLTSQAITEANLVGSILGTNIAVEHDGIENRPKNFAKLWLLHSRSDRTSNLARIVRETQAIKPRRAAWSLTQSQVSHILAAPELAATVSATPEYMQIANKLNGVVQSHREEILAAASTSRRGRADQIEELVTGAAKNQGLGDLTVQVLTTTISIDVKSKRLDLKSAPKAYNVDKMLCDLALGNRLLAVLFVGVDPSREALATRLVSVFDRTLLAATRVDMRWSGRGTRGTAQFSGDIDAIWGDGFSESIDVGQAQEFLRRLIARPPSTETS